MNSFNLLAIVVSALSTFVVGFIWYHPKVFGTIWMKEENLTENDLKKSNMFITFGLTFVFAFFISFIMQFLTIHQFGAFGMIGGDEAHAHESYKTFMTEYKDAFRTFKHGALHGFMTGLLFVFPLMATNGLFAHKSWKLIFIQSGYWTVSLIIIGAILSGWK